MVFSDKEALKKLNSILHPAIAEKILAIIKNSTSDIIIIDAPLLFAVKELVEICDETVAVTASRTGNHTAKATATVVTMAADMDHMVAKVATNPATGTGPIADTVVRKVSNPVMATVRGSPAKVDTGHMMAMEVTSNPATEMMGDVDPTARRGISNPATVTAGHVTGDTGPTIAGMAEGDVTTGPGAAGPMVTGRNSNPVMATVRGNPVRKHLRRFPRNRGSPFRRPHRGYSSRAWTARSTARPISPWHCTSTVRSR
ncbi:MAG: dephospho-CoA kinase [Candidatus Methanomethylophilaceae archaeon]|nr:dephospho-CoA kinase [Candidatus Methanomethylophilaceae archaeon]